MYKPRDFIGDTPTTGRGVVIAIIDSGFAKTDAFVGGWSVDGKPWTDATGHGTSVAWVANNAAPGAKLLGVRAMRDGSRVHYYEDVCAAIDYVGMWAKAHPGVRVVCNMSLTGIGWTGIESHIDALVAANIPVVVAAGNTGKEESNVYPSCCESPIVVGAVDSKGDPAPFSTRHEDVDVCQLGVDVCAGETVQSGTSFATPIVAALCALILSEHPTYTEPQVFSALLRGAKTVDFQGYKIPFVKMQENTGAYQPAKITNVSKGKVLRVRKGPRITTDIVGYVRGGDDVNAMRVSGVWREIRFDLDSRLSAVGWVNTKYVKED